MSKYKPLWNYLNKNKKDTYKLTYEEIKKILGFEIDHSFLTYKKELKEYGYDKYIRTIRGVGYIIKE